MLLCFKIGEKERNTAQKSTKAHDGNNKKGKTMHKQLIDYHQQNTAPNRNFNGLTDAVELYQVGGEGKRPHDVKTENDDNAPKRTLDAKIDDKRGSGSCKKRPTHNGEHSFAVLR